MKIGIDIDNVISNFNDTLLDEYLLYDKKLRNQGIINKNADYIRKGMFDWNEDEKINFYKNIVSKLRIDINTLKKYLENKSELCNYLLERFYNDGYHGIQESRVIWDISVIAYMINNSWFETKEINCPNIKEDTSYEIIDNRHNITFITKLDRNKIYKDLFRKLG